MTIPDDPMDGILLPFSIPMTPTLDAYTLFVPVEYRNSQGSYTNQKIRIPAGVSLTRITWSGLEPIRYRFDIHDAGTTTQSEWRPIIAPEATIRPRSSPPIEMALTEPADLWVQLSSRASLKTINGKCMAGVTVIPTAGPII